MRAVRDHLSIEEREWRCDLQFFVACFLAGLLLAGGMLAVGHVGHGRPVAQRAAR